MICRHPINAHSDAHGLLASDVAVAGTRPRTVQPLAMIVFW
jgi:hypothetical protein